MLKASLDKTIIIGFDSSDLYDSQYAAIKLSKSWQKMNVTTTEYQLPPNSINAIKFYGHSLGKQDYSYFHNIFD